MFNHSFSRKAQLNVPRMPFHFFLKLALAML